MIAKLICKLAGHKRGKRVIAATDSVRIILRCPRCGAQWTRKVKDAQRARTQNLPKAA